jgi:UDP-N-acetylmuramate-alanine ligase
MPEALRQMLRDGDVLIVMGAGSISTVPGKLAGK